MAQADTSGSQLNLTIQEGTAEGRHYLDRQNFHLSRLVEVIRDFD